MKKGKMNRSRKLSLLIYAGILVLAQMPWFLIDGKYLNIYQFCKHILQTGMEGLSESGRMIAEWSYKSENELMLTANIELFLVILYQIFCVFYIGTVLINKSWHLNIISLLILFEVIQFNAMGLGSISDNAFANVFPILFGVIGMAEFLIRRGMSEWDEATKEDERRKRRDKERKEERKRRLYFPGKYDKLFYKVVWKNFLYNRKDYMMFILCGTIVSGVVFAGFGMQKMMSGVHSEESFLITQGLGQILLNAMFPIGIIAVFLIVFVLIFYLKNRMNSYGMFVTLGIRSKTLIFFVALEFAGSFVCSILFGCLLGNGILLVFRQIVQAVLGDEVQLRSAGSGTYLKMLIAMAVIYGISLMATRDIYMDLNISMAAVMKSRKEKIPQKALKGLTAAGFLLTAGCVYEYSKLKNYESIGILGLFFVGIFLVIRYGGAEYLKQKRRSRSYLSDLMKNNQIYHKSKTSAWYLMVLTVIHICVLFYFSVQMISVTIAETPEELYPYDFMCIADEGDEEIWEKIQAEYEVRLDRYPMVRVSTPDKTKRLERRQDKPPQGQHISISESTYHRLKKELDEEYQEISLNLDENGEDIYVVHQQDKSIEAQPTDFFAGKEKPNLHIGQPCYDFSAIFPGNAFPERNIQGEEIESVTGCFRQGRLENLIVFSDAYFEKAQSMWKETNINTGEWIEAEEEQIPEVTIHQGPTELVLIRAEVEDLDALEKELETLRENHRYEAKFDSEVLSCYSKEAAVTDLKTERTMKLVVNLFVMLVLVMAGSFVLWIKVQSEMEEKRARSVFLECMGMRENDRERLIKNEISVFYIIPCLIAVFSSISFTAAVFCARMYTVEDIVRYSIRAAGAAVIYLLITGAFVKVLVRMSIRGIEERR